VTLSSLNVASHLVRMAALEPNRSAIHFPVRGVKSAGFTEHRTITFAELNADSNAIADGLSAIGITRGMRTALMVPPSPDFFALTFALFKLAAAPVFIDPGMGLKNLGKCLGEAEPEAFIAVPKAHLARRLFGWAKRTVRVTMNVGKRRFFCTSSLANVRSLARRASEACAEVEADETAAILFTSGSTGVAKGAVYTHGIFAAQMELLKATYGIEPGEVDLCTFPLFALFGPALGMTCVIPDMNPSRPATIDPHKAAAQIKQFQVTNMFGSPAVIRRMGDLTDTLPTLKRVISAGAPASVRDLERFTPLLPEGVEVFTPYGATEALPVANIGSREILNETRRLTEQGRGVCIGRPVAGMTVRVIGISDEPIAEWSDSLVLPQGEIGEFVVRGPVVTKEYLNRPEATKLAKIRDGEQILHRMGDVGYFDEQGRMWFCGRKSQRVITPWGTLFTDMVEPVFNTVPGAIRTALVGVTRDGLTYPVICFESEGDEDVIIDAMRRLATSYPHTRHIETFLPYHSAFPVDVRHNSKIFREKLVFWADQESGWRRLPTPVKEVH
jgi:acyl-CoA synthetase (AMP-forming)/AMP-acid ligase II